MVVGTHISTQSINSVKSEAGHSVCTFASEYCIKEGAVQIQGAGGNLTDLAWSRTAERHMLAAYDSGSIVLYDWKKPETIQGDPHTSATALGMIQEDGAVSRCLFLPHTHSSNSREETALTRCFLSASAQNSTITLWSPFTADGRQPSRLQVFGLENPSASYLVETCYILPPPLTPTGIPSKTPPSTMVVMADRSAGKIFAWHLKGAWSSDAGQPEGTRLVLEGCDYVVPFRCKFPTYSWHVRTETSSAEADDEDLSSSNLIYFDVQMSVFQSSAVQELSLNSMMLLPPPFTWTDPTRGVRVERLWTDVHSTHVSEVGSDDGVLKFDEEYDVDEDEDEDQEFDAAPDASTLPPPPGIIGGGASGGGNPFTNWLGSLAAEKPQTNPLPPLLSSKPLELPTTIMPPPPIDPAIIASASIPPPIDDPAIISSESIIAPIDKSSILSALFPSTTAREPTPTMSNRGDGATKSKGNGRDKTPNNRDTNSQLGDEDELRRVVKEEIQSSLGPLVEKAVNDAVNQVVLRPVLSSISDLSKREMTPSEQNKLASAVAASVDIPLKAAFHSTVKTAILPALESGMGLVLKQVSDQLEQSIFAVQANADNKKEIEAMSVQLTRMTELVARLTTEVQSLRATVETHQQQRAAPSPTSLQPPKKSSEEIRNGITQFCSARKYEEAFNLALTAADYRFTFLCCQQADISAVFGGEKIKLSPLILLCIMQHLIQVIVVANTDKEMEISLLWLQEIALSLNPPAREIRQHLPRVVEELTRAVNKRIEQGTHMHRNRDFQRILQIVRGLQL